MKGSLRQIERLETTVRKRDKQIEELESLIDRAIAWEEHPLARKPEPLREVISDMRKAREGKDDQKL